MKWGSLARIWTGLNPGGMLQLAGDGVVFHWPGPKLIRHRCWSVCATIVRDYFCWWETPVLTAKLIKLPMWHMAHSMGDWMGQTWIECDYGAWRVQFKYPVQYRAPHYQRHCYTSQELLPMGAQLSLKAAMLMAETPATCRKNASNTGPWGPRY